MTTPSATPTKRSGTHQGLGTYLGLAGALLAMIVLFSSLSSHFPVSYTHLTLPTKA